MDPNYEFVKMAGAGGPNGYLVLRHWKHGDQIWTRCKVRKDWECEITGKPILKGKYAYRPVTNALNRMHRISLGGALRLAKEKEKNNG